MKTKIVSGFQEGQDTASDKGAFAKNSTSIKRWGCPTLILGGERFDPMDEGIDFKLDTNTTIRSRRSLTVTALARTPRGYKAIPKQLSALVHPGQKSVLRNREHETELSRRERLRQKWNGQVQV